jgi:hypothetical protein
MHSSKDCRNQSEENLHLRPYGRRVPQQFEAFLMSTVFRKPRRLTITVSQHVMERLQNSSDQQGRSLSNYAAYLLECALHRSAADAERQERSGAGSPVHLQRAA